MGKRILILMILPVLLLALVGVAQAWQGRMGGMGDPYGLVQDESDFLVHPAKIANGEGVRFYGNYRFLYTGVTDWNSHIAFFDGGVFDWQEDLGLSGNEQGHNGLAGAAFPLGPGRMGLFFEYAGKKSGYDGYRTYWYDDYNLQLNSSFDDFALRLLYGLGVGSVKLGVEVQVAYRQEKQEYSQSTIDWDSVFFNPSFYWYDYEYLYIPTHLPIGFFPYDSNYWEGLLKGSAAFALGPADVEIALRGGVILSGDNKWESAYYEYGTQYWDEKMKGDVGGWRVGGDMWVRYPLGKGLSLPFLVRADYQEKTRDGDGVTYEDEYGYWFSNHKITEKNLQLEAGGGLDKELSKTTRIAAGIYYNYLQRKDNRSYHVDEGYYYPYEFDTNFKSPDVTEHRLVIKLAGEHELSPVFSLRGGVNCFYGWTKLRSTFSYYSYDWDVDYGWTWDTASTQNGYHLGIGASLGGSIKLKSITLEPFVTGGWQQLKVNGDGDATWQYSYSAPTYYTLHEDLTRSEWFAGGGLSILFNL